MLNAPQNTNVPPPPVMSLTPGKNNQASVTQAKAGGQAAEGNAEIGKTVGGKAAAGKGSVEESQDRFLKLLVTQMKNQDPLNPMDNAQVTSQMAQLSTVSGIDKLNATLEALSGSMIATNAMQASSMIGHVVVVPGSKLELKAGKAAAALDLTQPADNVTVQIKDAMGNVVRNLDMGSQPTGMVAVQWDGKNDQNLPAKDGSYQFSAIAMLGKESTSVNTLSYGLVSGVIQKPEGTRLSVENLGDVKMDSVKQIL
jgi:flagellar basal-body rod modification protein FlgD